MSLKKLIKWSETEFTSLPWRNNRSLYGTLVSEIMLQQTTVSTVKNHFDRFMKRFPDLQSLADATEEELLVAWKGLGYYRRARSLKKISEALSRDHAGKFPKSAAELQAITGIGPYTAHALLSIGMDLPALAVDANLERVISRLFGIKVEKGPKLQKHILHLFLKEEIFSERDISFRALNEALMDLGRTYCQARKAECALCPLKKDCVAFKSGEPLQFPLENTKMKKTKAQDHDLHLLRVFVMKNDKILVYKKAENEWLAGQYEVPTFLMKTTDENFSQYPVLKCEEDSLSKSYVTGITKYKIKNFILVANEKKLKSLSFNRKTEWRSFLKEDSNLSTATIKGLAKL